MKQNITNVTVAGHRFTVMHTGALTNAFCIDAIYIGDHPDSILHLLLLNKGSLRGILAAVADANATPNTPNDPNDPNDLALFDATEARVINEDRSA